MKVKILLSLLVIVMLFSFVLPTNDSTPVNQEKATQQERVNVEKEPMQPFAMTDENQFD